jgi:hypothetical protein
MSLARRVALNISEIKMRLTINYGDNDLEEKSSRFGGGHVAAVSVVRRRLTVSRGRPAASSAGLIGEQT